MRKKCTTAATFLYSRLLSCLHSLKNRKDPARVQLRTLTSQKSAIWFSAGRRRVSIARWLEVEPKMPVRANLFSSDLFGFWLCQMQCCGIDQISETPTPAWKNRLRLQLRLKLRLWPTSVSFYTCRMTMFKKPWYTFFAMSLIQNIVGNQTTNLVRGSLPGPRIKMQIWDNYLSVNRNGLSDHQTLTLVKVKCVLKTTECTPPKVGIPILFLVPENI